MVTKQNLIDDLRRAVPFDELEKSHIDKTVALLESTDKCFERKDFPGHITGSAWLISPDGRSVLLTHHAFLNMWFQFGGHADGEVDIKNVALREAREESGIDDIEFVSHDIFDVDVHEIPANPKKGEPAHFHYDIRYLMRAKTLEYKVSSESNDLKWLTLEEILGMEWGEVRLRMVKKWQNFLAGKK